MINGSDFDKIHTSGLDKAYVRAQLSGPVTGTQNAAPNQSEYIVGIQTIEVGKDPTSLQSVTVSDTKQKLKLATQTGAESEVMGQLIYDAYLEHEKCDVIFHTTGNVITAIASKLTSDLKFTASTLQADLYIKLSKATDDQLTNSEGKTLKAFMINDDDFMMFRMSYDYFLREHANGIKGRTEKQLHLGSGNMLPESYKVGFCPKDDDTFKSTVSLNYAAA